MPFPFSGVIGKAKGQLPRLAGALQANADAAWLLTSADLARKGPIDKEFMDTVLLHASKMESKIITKQVANQAVHLIETFISHKTYLSGYPASETQPALPHRLMDIGRKVILYGGLSVKQSDFKHRYRDFDTADILLTFKGLSSLSLGRHREVKASNNKVSHSFEKVQLDRLDKDEILSLTTSLKSLDLSLEQLTLSYTASQPSGSKSKAKQSIQAPLVSPQMVTARSAKQEGSGAANNLNAPSTPISSKVLQTVDMNAMLNSPKKKKQKIAQSSKSCTGISPDRKSSSISDNPKAKTKVLRSTFDFEAENSD